MGAGALVMTLIAASAGTLALGLISKWVDRKVTARVQWRVGPPWYQPTMDIVKLLGKETLMPSTAQGTGFLLAPLVGFAAACVAATLLWGTNLRPDVSFLGDLIVLIYLLVIPSLMVVLGGAASGNPYSVIGATREMKLMLSYELPFILVLLVGVVHGGWTFRLGDLVTHEPALYSLSGVLAMLVAILCVQAKLGLVPFDLPEAETELMAGVYTEYSGPPLAVFFATRALMLALLPLMLISVFWGGVDLAGWGLAASIGKYVLLLVIIVLIRNTNPRARIDQTVKFFWYVLTPIGIIAIVLAVLGERYGYGWL